MPSTPAPSRWFPNLKGVADPKKPFEVQTADGLHQLTSYFYQLNDQVQGMASASSPGSAPAGTQPASWWTRPYAADPFTANGGATSITVTWASYRIAPTTYVNRKTPYILVPNGSITASGLTATTNYWFYPAYDTRKGQLVWTTDPALVVAGTFAHTGPSAVALMRASSGGNASLSLQGIIVKTGAGALTGLGGGLLHGTQT